MKLIFYCFSSRSWPTSSEEKEARIEDQRVAQDVTLEFNLVLVVETKCFWFNIVKYIS